MKRTFENHVAWSAYENLYVCEPKKNKECKKNNCFMDGGSCFLTGNRKFAKE